MKHVTNMLLLSCFLTAGGAGAKEYREKHALPPVWDVSDLQRTQPDFRIRTYITPKRIVWKNSDNIRDTENLL
ncbi:MAG: hypothetical protein LBG28_00005, partial [Tannerella sp.]|nr:hypothetical protein [Tannerella sp.]